MNDKFYDKRPWGDYLILRKEPGFWVKRINVNPGERLSLQYHKHRSEEWIVVQGHGYATVNGNEIEIREGSHIHIGVESLHRIQNNGFTPLIFIEVALGTDLREDDIIRVADDYGRNKQ